MEPLSECGMASGWLSHLHEGPDTVVTIMLPLFWSREDRAGINEQPMARPYAGEFRCGVVTPCYLPSP